MLTLRDLSFRLEGKPLFEGASAAIPTGATVGVVGRNGTGKTTLFRLIYGELSLDSGAIDMPRGARIGGVSQEVPSSEVSLLDTVLAADRERTALMTESETATDPNRIAEIQMRLVDIGAHSAEARAGSILQGLGFDAEAQARPCSAFSGGWRMRVALAAVLFSAPDLLLLDEPSNYLDLEGAVWLENFLSRYPHTCLVISHDRGLLNRSVKGILHLHDRKLTYYTGGYDAFDAQRRATLEQQMSAKKKQDAQRAHIQSFVDRFRAKATKARQAQSRLKLLEKMQPIAAVTENAVAEFRFDTPSELPPPLITVSEGTVGYEDTPVLKGLNFRIDQDDRIALLGANGQGKSTLSKLIGGRLSAMDGTETRARKLRIGYFAQHQLDELHREDTPIQHLAREWPDVTPSKLRARLGAAGFGADLADVAVGRLSGGQRARLLMMLATLEAPHLLILDEPTNHLDIESRDALSQALNAYRGAVILVSHDHHLVETVADRLWLVRDGRVAPFDGDMEDYRRLLLSKKGEGGAVSASAQPMKKSDRRKAAAQRRALAPLRDEVSRCEARVAKLNDMLGKIDAKMRETFDADDVGATEIERLGVKRGEIVDGIEKAEALWLEALEALERANSGS